MIATRSSGRFRLERRVGRFGTIDVVERRDDGARAYLQNGQLQSWALPGGVSLIAYVQAIRAILVQARCHRIAVLGAAGGTLGTMMAAAGAAPVLVDVNPEAFELARRFFWLPDAVECVVADARQFLADRAELFDAIVLDTFDGDDALPPALSTAAFFDLARRRLLPQGLLIVNVPIGRERHARIGSLAAAVAASGFPVSVFEDPRQFCRNAVVVGGVLPAIALPMGDEPPETRRELESLQRRRADASAVGRR